MRHLFTSIILMLAITISHAAEPDFTIAPDPFFEGYTWTLLLESSDGSVSLKHNPELADTPLPPCSTFKIPNAMIGLDSGVVDGPEHVFPFTGKPTWNDTWNKDHSLRTAFKTSAVWYFQRLARSVGEEKMQAYLDTLNYGNRDISAGIDTFWLGSSLKISPRQQLSFIKSLHAETLPFPKEVQRTVNGIMIYRETDEYTLRGKTGSDWDEKYILGWYVGWIERGEKAYFFAAATQDGELPSGRNTRDMLIQWFEAVGLMEPEEEN